MSRARGKHPGRGVDVREIDPESPEGRQLGMSPRTQGVPSPIPGGRPHIQNAPTIRQHVPIPDAPAEVRDLNAHGVPPGSATTHERAELERGPNTIHAGQPEHEHRAELPAPIPVYIVQSRGPSALRTAAPHSFALQANTGDPVRLCGRDFTRTIVKLMNESTSSDIRWAQRPGDLINGGGALLPKSTTSYHSFETQDELWALSADSGTPRVSVVQVFERQVS